MKKMKAFATSLLCLLMSGTMLFSVGCGGNGENASGGSVPPAGGSESVGGETGGEKPSAGVASKEDKKYFFNTLAGTVGSFETDPNQTIKVTVDFDIKMVETDYEYDPYTDTDVEITTIDDITVDAVAYGKYVGEVLAVDAWAEGTNEQMYNSEKTNNYAYYAAYIRGDDIYLGGNAFEELPTQADKDQIVYGKESLSAIIEDIMASINGSQGNPELDPGVSTVAATQEETAIGWEAFLAQNQDLIVKAATNVFNGLTANVEVNGDVLTLVLDFKKEAESLVTVMESVANTIGENTKLSDLLGNKALEGLFNKYLGDITAAEMQQVLLAVLPMTNAPERILAAVKAPEAGDSGYQYLVKTVCAFPISETELLGEQVFAADDKQEMLEIIGVAKAALAEVNALKFSMSVENNEFRGISLDVDINNVVDMYFSIALDMGVSYEFKDVTTLTLYQAE